MACNKINPEESILYLPWNVLDACNGFNVDIGGSVMKLVYIHKDDWVKTCDRKSEKGPVRLVNFSRDEIPQAYAYIRERAYIKYGEGDNKAPHIYTTGVGGSQFMSELRSELSVRTENLTEMDLFVETFKYCLQNNSHSELIRELSEPTLKIAESRINGFKQMLLNMNKQKFSSMAWGNSKQDEEEDEFMARYRRKIDPDSKFTTSDVYPSLLVMCGSAGLVMRVEADGTFSSLEFLRVCGRMFLGLGCLLTNAKTFDELMALAEKGNPKTLHQYVSSFKSSIPSEDTSMYSNLNDFDESEGKDPVVFLFGNAVGKGLGDFKREDLARALVVAMVMDLVQTVHLAASKFPAKSIFFCGNYLAHPLIRHYITEDWIVREGQMFYLMQKKPMDFHFLKHGAHYGALGALLNHQLKFTDKIEEMKAKAAENFAKVTAET